jgi:YHS domain-containing protein
MPRITGSLDEGRITFGDRNAAAHTKARDPVCGALIDPSAARAVSVHEGHSYFLCSEECKVAFEASPERYIGAIGSPGRP